MRVKILGRNRASIADKITGGTKYFLLDTSKVSCTTELAQLKLIAVYLLHAFDLNVA